MQQLAALRPLVTAGAAAVGASVIALTPAISNDLASDLQHSAAALQQRAVELTDYVANPIQTWIDTFETAGINLQSLAAQYQNHPLIVPQQLAANFMQYAYEYVQPYTQAATSAVNFYLGTNPNDFVGLMQQAFAAALAGNFNMPNTGAASLLENGLFYYPAVEIGEPLETIPQILNPITQNLANTTDFLTTTGITDLGANFVISLPGQLTSALGNSAQYVYDSWTAGDPVGAVLNAINTPGAVANALLNGTLNARTGLYSGGIFSDGSGLLRTLGIVLPQGLTEKIVAPGAQNIMTGGSLSYALGYLANLVTTGFPTPQTVFDNLVNWVQTYLLGGFSSAAAATSPAADSIVSTFNPADILNGGSAMASLVADLPGLSADVGNIAGHLGADLASVLPGMILSVLHF
ncbi:hypothetical protein K3U93_22120 [Mycobacterium malmoense]|uniref:PE-PGRS family protein n=1 Tax=Mycobacterium malmoense TaxID=1780 RepID=A0ABX3SJW7_MYCMA|nr:hypothetical protein [Mycobacterium malmoense]ORA76801.1 hypothetical protein BST29_24410 [Mycobacterium malmoense]QZA17251.1 hypothetical protein K3U93_22120 [Mycobacterium malmoense]UNB94041.1 hypothetical protein H5T25_22095 [Mycobacterium malmoense]